LAIEEGYGAPAAYRDHEKRRNGKAHTLRNGRQSHEDVSNGPDQTWLIGWLRGEGEESHPEAFSAFLADEERTLAAHRESEHRSRLAAEVVRSFFDEARRLDRLEDFRAAHPEYHVRGPGTIRSPG
jgi:hypothetical protein